jgi:heat shock protein HslJ
MNGRAYATLLLLSATSSVTLAANTADISGTSWQLVKIMLMDDSSASPDDPSKYTLNFGQDGRATIQADCNRGAGSWSSRSQSQLAFSKIASTRALCPPGSISEKFLAQFEWVRSYTVKDGHLFLATMADGSIIEFEPLGSVVATVYGEEIRTSDAARVQEMILTRLFDRYAADNAIQAEPEEIEAYLEKMRRGMAEEGLTADRSLTPAEAEEVAAMRRNMAQSIVHQWKINKSLYEKYGGRIIYQQLGPEPLDAYRKFLAHKQREGTFSIDDKAMADTFWRYFTDESIHDFMERGGPDEARAFSVPPWQQ